MKRARRPLHVTCGTVRLNVLNICVHLTLSVRRVRFATAWPYQHVFRHVLHNLARR